MKIDQEYHSFMNEQMTTTNKSMSSLRSYGYDIKAFITFLGDKSLNQRNVDEYFSYLLKEGKKTSTISRKRISLKIFFAYLRKKKLIRVNYADELHIELIKEKRIPRTITLSSIRKILSFLRGRIKRSKNDYEYFINVRNLALFDLLISTGIRIGEASSIKLTDIDVSERTILIHGKGRKERMTYISSSDAWNNIMNYIYLRRKKPINEGYLFINRFDEKLSVHSIGSFFRFMRRKLKLKITYTPHCFRHTFATNLLSNGGDIRSVQELLGHASISTTEIYTHVDMKRKKRVLERYNYRNKLEKKK